MIDSVESFERSRNSGFRRSSHVVAVVLRNFVVVVVAAAAEVVSYTFPLSLSYRDFRTCHIWRHNRSSFDGVGLEDSEAATSESWAFRPPAEEL